MSVEEEEYLGAVTDAQLLTVKVFMGFGEIFSRTYPVREALLAALLEGGVVAPFIENLAALQTLDSPDRFREDHRIWLELTTENLRSTPKQHKQFATEIWSDLPTSTANWPRRVSEVDSRYLPHFVKVLH